MNQKQKKYLIYNVTRQEPRYDNKSGKDMRTTRQRVGHAVAFRDRYDHAHLVVAGGRPVLVDEVTPGMMALATPDPVTGEVHLRIREIDDVMEALKEHTLPARAARPKAEASALGTAQGSVVQEATPPSRRPSLEGNTAVEMGKDQHAQRGGTEHEGAVNPSGDPNFLVRAPAGEQHGRRAARRNAASKAAAVDPSATSLLG